VSKHGLNSYISNTQALNENTVSQATDKPHSISEPQNRLSNNIDTFLFTSVIRVCRKRKERRWTPAWLELSDYQPVAFCKEPDRSTCYIIIDRAVDFYPIIFFQNCRQLYFLNGKPRIPIPTMYDRNFKPKIFTDITMTGKLFVAQILAPKKRQGIIFVILYYRITISFELRYLQDNTVFYSPDCYRVSQHICTF